MSVTFQGSLTLGKLIPALDDAVGELTSALDSLTSDKGEISELVSMATGKVDAIQKLVEEAQKTVDTYQDKFESILQTAESYADIVSSVADNLSAGGVYVYSIDGSTLSSIGSEIAAIDSDEIEADATVSGFIILASDGGAISAIRSILKI